MSDDPIIDLGAAIERAVMKSAQAVNNISLGSIDGNQVKASINANPIEKSIGVKLRMNF